MDTEHNQKPATPCYWWFNAIVCQTVPFPFSFLSLRIAYRFVFHYSNIGRLNYRRRWSGIGVGHAGLAFGLVSVPQVSFPIPV